MSDESNPAEGAAIRAYDDHASIVGMVAVSWNGAQESLYLMFVVLMGLRKPEAEAIFFTLKADSAQRDITRELAKAVLAHNADLLKRTTEAINAFDRLAGERNAAIHTMWHASIGEGTVRPSPHAKRHGALRPDHRTQFLQLTHKLADLEGELFDLAREIQQHLASRDISHRQTIP
jgi:hypothetical protein